MAIDNDTAAICIRLCVTLAIVAVGALFTFMSREAHSVPTRAGACPSPPLPFPAGADEQGTQFAHSFAAKRDYGAWRATVELGTMDADDDFAASGHKLEVDGCHWWSPWVRNRYINLVDGGGEVLASVDSDPFSLGWSIKVYDCKGRLSHTIEESRDVIKGRRFKGAELTVASPAGQTVGTSAYDWAWLGTNVMALSDGAGAVVARATTPSVYIGTQEWRLYAQGGEGAGDPAVIAAVAAYKTWVDKKKNCKDCSHSDFSGTCEPFIFWGEILLLVVLCGVGFIALTAAEAACDGCWGQLSDCCRRGYGGGISTAGRASKIGGSNPVRTGAGLEPDWGGMTSSNPIHCSNPTHAVSSDPVRTVHRSAVTLFESEVTRAKFGAPPLSNSFKMALPAGSQLPPTVSV